ncbi:FHA domain-containing protein [Rhodopseudomonas palustris]|nr:FHA domain-containing protein [Rhodopseudomonas palustris]
MASEDETRRVVEGYGESVKTRLVRRDEEQRVQQQPVAPAADEINRTRMILRPQAAPTTPTSEGKSSSNSDRLIVGWLVVVNGPGRGRFASIYDGLNSIGRGPTEATVLNFGDDGISREQHAFITYDYKTRLFYLQHGGKAGIVRLNDQPVLQPMILNDRDVISISQTTVRFVAFCGPQFDWAD